MMMKDFIVVVRHCDDNGRRQARGCLEHPDTFHFMSAAGLDHLWDRIRRGQRGLALATPCPMPPSGDSDDMDDRNRECLPLAITVFEVGARHEMPQLEAYKQQRIEQENATASAAQQQHDEAELARLAKKLGKKVVS